MSCVTDFPQSTQPISLFRFRSHPALPGVSFGQSLDRGVQDADDIFLHSVLLLVPNATEENLVRHVSRTSAMVNARTLACHLHRRE